jgi:hypothetical protein
MRLFSIRPFTAIPQVVREWTSFLTGQYLVGTPNTPIEGLYTGTGSPESVVTAPQGSLYLRTDGGASTTLYVKESGGVTSPTATGWAAK